MDTTNLDRLYLLATIRLAEKGLYSVTRNNPRVGCLLVKDGRVIGRGFHQRDGGDHAEVVALKRTTERTEGSTAYVSLEPCCIQGRTPACTDALIQAGIRRVVCAERDPHAKVDGKGIEILQQSGIEVSLLEIPEARNLNPGYRKRVTEAKPYVRIKSGMSLDGRIAMASGESQWITGAEARLDVQRLRGRSAAIVSGIGTVLKDNPRFTVRAETYSESRPIRVVFDTKGRLPSDAKMLQVDGDIVVVCNENASLPQGVEKWTHSENHANLDAVLSRLAEEGANEVLVEAGSKLTGSFLRSGLWDELVVYVAPKLLGSRSRALADIAVDRLCDGISGSIESIERLGQDVRIVITKRTAR